MIEWTLRVLLASTLLALAATAVDRALRWRGAARRGGWAVAMLLTLLLPLLAPLLPELIPALELPISTTDLGMAVDPAATTAATPSAGPAGRTISWATGAAAAWVALSLAGGLLLAWTSVRLHALRRQGRLSRVGRHRVLLTASAGPAVIGVVDPLIVLPAWVAAADEETRRLIVAHEASHIDARDPALLLAASVLVALMPWNPALWWMHRRLRLAVETDCDARLVASGIDRRSYGQVLIRTAGAPRPAWLAPAWGEQPTLLEERIVAMTQPSRPRAARAAAPALLTAALLATVAACEMLDRGGVSAPAAPTVETRPGPNGGTVTLTSYPDGLSQVEVRAAPDPNRGSLGMSYSFAGPIHVRPGQPRPERLPHHPVVGQVTPGGSADQAGLQQGDVMLTVNGRDGREGRLFPDRTPGAEYRIVYLRGGREGTAVLRMGAPEAS